MRENLERYKVGANNKRLATTLNLTLDIIFEGVNDLFRQNFVYSSLELSGKSGGITFFNSSIAPTNFYSPQIANSQHNVVFSDIFTETWEDFQINDQEYFKLSIAIGSSLLFVHRIDDTVGLLAPKKDFLHDTGFKFSQKPHLYIKVVLLNNYLFVAYKRMEDHRCFIEVYSFDRHTQISIDTKINNCFSIEIKFLYDEPLISIVAKSKDIQIWNAIKGTQIFSSSYSQIADELGLSADEGIDTNVVITSFFSINKIFGNPILEILFENLLHFEISFKYLGLIDDTAKLESLNMYYIKSVPNLGLRGGCIFPDGFLIYYPTKNLLYTVRRNNLQSLEIYNYTVQGGFEFVSEFKYACDTVNQRIALIMKKRGITKRPHCIMIAKLRDETNLFTDAIDAIQCTDKRSVEIYIANTKPNTIIITLQSSINPLRNIFLTINFGHTKELYLQADKSIKANDRILVSFSKAEDEVADLDNLIMVLVKDSLCFKTDFKLTQQYNFHLPAKRTDNITINLSDLVRVDGGLGLIRSKRRIQGFYLNLSSMRFAPSHLVDKELILMDERVQYYRDRILNKDGILHYLMYTGEKAYLILKGKCSPDDATLFEQIYEMEPTSFRYVYTTSIYLEKDIFFILSARMLFKLEIIIPKQICENSTPNVQLEKIRLKIVPTRETSFEAIYSQNGQHYFAYNGYNSSIENARTYLYIQKMSFAYRIRDQLQIQLFKKPRSDIFSLFRFDDSLRAVLLYYNPSQLEKLENSLETYIIEGLEVEKLTLPSLNGIKSIKCMTGHYCAVIINDFGAFILKINKDSERVYLHQTFSFAPNTIGGDCFLGQNSLYVLGYNLLQKFNMLFFIGLDTDNYKLSKKLPYIFNLLSGIARNNMKNYESSVIGQQVDLSLPNDPKIALISYEPILHKMYHGVLKNPQITFTPEFDGNFSSLTLIASSLDGMGDELTLENIQQNTTFTDRLITYKNTIIWAISCSFAILGLVLIVALVWRSKKKEERISEKLITSGNDSINSDSFCSNEK